MRDFLIAVGLIAVCFFGYFYSMSEDLLSGVVVDKSYKDAYSTTDIVIIGDFMYPQTIIIQNHINYRSRANGQQANKEQNGFPLIVKHMIIRQLAMNGSMINISKRSE